MNHKNLLTPKQIEEISNDRKLRIGVAQGNFELFFMLYCSHHMNYSLESFHKEMMYLGTQENKDIVNIMAFRGSGKSTLITLGLSLWSILSQKKQFILIISQSYSQAKLFLESICIEIETNALLKSDFHFLLHDKHCGKTEIRIGNTYITIACTKTTLRGIKKGNTRPDLIICDDIEDSEGVKSSKKRESLYDWFKKEVIPLGGDTTKIILLGNYLGYHCLLNQLSFEMDQGVLKGLTRKYPIITEDNTILWKGKYTEKDVEEIEKNIGNKTTWYNEFLIQGVPYEGNIVTQKDFKFYYGKPKRRVVPRKSGGVYISPTQTDGNRGKILICGATIFDVNIEAKIFIHPGYVYKKLTDKEIICQALELTKPIITKRKRIFFDKEKMEGVIYNYLSSENIYPHGILFKRYDTRSVFIKGTREINYDAVYKQLMLLISYRKIVFPKRGGQYIMEEILGYKVDGYSSPFMKDFLEMIHNLGDAGTDMFTRFFGDDRRSPFINCCVLDEEFFYADEEVKYKHLTGDLVDRYKGRYKYM